MYRTIPDLMTLPRRQFQIQVAASLELPYLCPQSPSCSGSKSCRAKNVGVDAKNHWCCFQPLLRTPCRRGVCEMSRSRRDWHICQAFWPSLDTERTLQAAESAEESCCAVLRAVSVYSASSIASRSTSAYCPLVGASSCLRSAIACSARLILSGRKKGSVSRIAARYRLCH